MNDIKESSGAELCTYSMLHHCSCEGETDFAKLKAILAPANSKMKRRKRGRPYSLDFSLSPSSAWRRREPRNCLKMTVSPTTSPWGVSSRGLLASYCMRSTMPHPICQAQPPPLLSTHTWLHHAAKRPPAAPTTSAIASLPQHHSSAGRRSLLMVPCPERGEEDRRNRISSRKEKGYSLLVSGFVWYQVRLLSGLLSSIILYCLCLAL